MVSLKKDELFYITEHNTFKFQEEETYMPSLNVLLES